jgi:hypothetical protein
VRACRLLASCRFGRDGGREKNHACRGKEKTAIGASGLYGDLRRVALVFGRLKNWDNKSGSVGFAPGSSRRTRPRRRSTPSRPLSGSSCSGAVWPASDARRPLLRRKSRYHRLHCFPHLPLCLPWPSRPTSARHRRSRALWRWLGATKTRIADEQGPSRFTGSWSETLFYRMSYSSSLERNLRTMKKSIYRVPDVSQAS